MTLLGHGIAASASFRGPDRFERAQLWWEELVAHATITDEVDRPGSGLVSFGSFAFSDDDTSTVIVPATIHGSDTTGSWVTHVCPTEGDGVGSSDTDHAIAGSGGVERASDGRQIIEPGRVLTSIADTQESYISTVASIVDELEAGRARKVVLSTVMDIETQNPIDERAVVRNLADAYPSTWTYCVDSLVGATPEMLASVRGSALHTRVLAGSWPTVAGAPAARAALETSDKDRAEHRYAVVSVTDALTGHATDLTLRGPDILTLPNVVHYSTDITATATSSGLQIAGAMHPTAAVGGTPKDVALRMIREVEEHSRSRYAAPVGWMDDRGNADWALALRCAHLTGEATARAYAGGGLVAGSTPAVEIAEVSAKFSAILAGFGTTSL